MSLVGTRPILQDELQKYELHHRARIAIKPGITGMWQVSGRNDSILYKQIIEKLFGSSGSGFDVSSGTGQYRLGTMMISLATVFQHPLGVATEEYYEAIYIMPPIAGGVFLTCVSNMYSNIMIYYKKTQYIMYGYDFPVYFIAVNIGRG